MCRINSGFQVIGAIKVFSKPRNQGIFVKTMAIGTLIDALAQMYSTFFESMSNIWFDLIPELVLLYRSALFWISLKQVEAILWYLHKLMLFRKHLLDLFSAYGYGNDVINRLCAFQILKNCFDIFITKCIFNFNTFVFVNGQVIHAPLLFLIFRAYHCI